MGTEDEHQEILGVNNGRLTNSASNGHPHSLAKIIVRTTTITVEYVDGDDDVDETLVTTIIVADDEAILTTVDDVDEGCPPSPQTGSLSTINSERKEVSGHEYPLANDESELDRLYMDHEKFVTLSGNKLFHSPLPEDLHNVLDVGTGTGIWAIEMADEYPSASVYGVDQTNIQPKFVPPNCTFEVDDVEREWIDERTYDFIHGRGLQDFVRDWPKLIGQSKDSLNPGGYLELCDIEHLAVSDDGSLKPESNLAKLLEMFNDTLKKIGCDPECPRKFECWLREAGFEDVKKRVYKIPVSPWMEEIPVSPCMEKHRKREILLGKLQKQSIIDKAKSFQNRGVLNLAPELFELFLAGVRRDLQNPDMRLYVQWQV